jgi:hypothetical protein
MRKLLSKLWQGACAALVGLSLFGLLAGPAAALTNPPSYAPRQFPTQQTHYLRFVVNFNSCPLPASPGSCNFKVGALPYNAWLLRLTYQGITAFGSTTNNISIGTASAGTQILAATDFHTAVALTQSTSFAGAGQGATGNGASQTGGDGGFDVWINLAYTGAAPSAGQAVFLLEFAAPNDGLCAPVPMNTTAGAC